MGDRAADHAVNPVQQWRREVRCHLENHPHQSQENRYPEQPAGQNPVQLVCQREFILSRLANSLIYKAIDPAIAAIGDDRFHIVAIDLTQVPNALLRHFHQLRTLLQRLKAHLNGLVFFQ